MAINLFKVPREVEVEDSDQISSKGSKSDGSWKTDYFSSEEEM